MLYPPKKRAYSPENKKTKELSNLMNINSKFTGSGGSNPSPIQTPPPSPPKSPSQSPKNPSPASSPATSTFPPTQDLRISHPLQKVLRPRRPPRCRQLPRSPQKSNPSVMQLTWKMEP